MQNRPWFEESDPIKDFYGNLDEEDIKWICNLLKNVDLCQAKFNLNTDVHTTRVQILDFSDYYGKPYQFELLSNLIDDFYHADQHLFWLPLNNDCSENAFEKFEPLMIAKTPMDIIYLEKVSQSMMQMVNGGYVVADSGENFIAIIIDGYYMLSLICSDLKNKYEIYSKNWELIDEKLDSITADTLLSKKP